MWKKGQDAAESLSAADLHRHGPALPLVAVGFARGIGGISAAVFAGAARASITHRSARASTLRSDLAVDCAAPTPHHEDP